MFLQGLYIEVEYLVISLEWLILYFPFAACSGAEALTVVASAAGPSCVDSSSGSWE